MAQSASTGIGSTKSIGGLHNPWIKTELLRSVAKGVGDGPPSLAAFAQVLDLRAIENGAAGHCVLSDTSHSVGAVLVPACVKKWKASMPGATLSQLNGATVLVRAFRVAINAQKGHFLLHLHELRFIERRACVAGGLASGAPVSVMEDLAVVAAFQAACQMALAPPPAAPAPPAPPPPVAAARPRRRPRRKARTFSAPRWNASGAQRRRRRRRRKRRGRRDGVAARRDGDAARARRVARERRRRRWRRVCGRVAGVGAVRCVAGRRRRRRRRRPRPADAGAAEPAAADDAGASQWAASQASQLPSPPSPGGDGGEPLTQAPLPSPPPMTQGVAVGRRFRVGGRGAERDGVGFSQPSGDGAANGGGAPMEVEEEEEEDDGGDFDPSDPLDLKSVDPWEVARQCLPPLPAHVLAPT